jgi:hypothetical protein
VRLGAFIVDEKDGCLNKRCDINIKKEVSVSSEEIKRFVKSLDMSKFKENGGRIEDIVGTLREIKDELSYEYWFKIFSCFVLTENFIREFYDKAPWNFVNYQKLSENFIRDFQADINWSKISENQTLSEDFIRDFQDKVDWNKISEYQKLSDSFCVEFFDC